MRLGVIGYGAIGRFIMASLSAGSVPGTSLVAVAARSGQSQAAAEQTAGCRVTADPLELPRLGAELVVEAAGVAAACEYALPLLAAGVDIMLMSVGALAESAFRARLVAAALENSRKVYVPSGGLGGLDLVRAASVGRIDQAMIITHKPPAGLRGAPHFQRNPVNLDALQGPTVVFEGTAAEAIRAFPANVNVAIALSLAGIGPDRTTVRIVAEPGLARNVHEVVVVGEFGEFRAEVANVPSMDNPRTAHLAALSAVATLQSIASPLRIGN